MQPEKSLDELACEPYFRMVVHGVFGGEIVTIKISSESGMLEGGSSILEALDHLFKLFWIFDIQYTVGCENVFKLLHAAIFSQLKDGAILKSTQRWCYIEIGLRTLVCYLQVQSSMGNIEPCTCKCSFNNDNVHYEIFLLANIAFWVTA